MRKLVYFGLSLIAVLVCTGVARAQVEIPCGEVVGMKLTDGSDLNIAWEEAKVRKFGKKPTLEEGEKYAVVTVALTKGKSIGKWDFNLSGRPCLAISLNLNAFDPANWKYEDQPSNTQVRLLFIVPENEDQAGYVLAWKHFGKVPHPYAEEKAPWVSQTISTRIGAPISALNPRNVGGNGDADDDDDDDDDAAPPADADDDDGDDDDADAAEKQPEKKEPEKKEPEKEGDDDDDEDANWDI